MAKKVMVRLILKICVPRWQPFCTCSLSFCRKKWRIRYMTMYSFVLEIMALIHSFTTFWPYLVNCETYILSWKTQKASFSPSAWVQIHLHLKIYAIILSINLVNYLILYYSISLAQPIVSRSLRLVLSMVITPL